MDPTRSGLRYGSSGRAYLPPQGAYISALRHQQHWIKRRVETIRLIDDDTLERHITLDIDTEVVRANARAVGFVDGDLHVPVAVLRKNLILDLDIRDRAGTPMSMLTSREDSAASVASVWREMESAGFSGHPDALEAAEHLYLVASEHPEVPFEGGPASELGVPERWIPADASPTLRGLIRTMWLEPSVRVAMETLETQFMLLVALPEQTPVAMIKLRFIEVGLRPLRPRPSQGIGDWLLRLLALRPGRFAIEDTGLGKALSAHQRVVAPAGTQIESASLTLTDTWGDLFEAFDFGAPAAEVFSFRSYQRRTTTDRAAIYGSNLPDQERRVVVDIAPQGTRFANSGALTAAIGTAVLTAGAWAERALKPSADIARAAFADRGYVTNFAASQLDVLVAMVLVVPSLYALYLSRSGEHQIRSRLLRVPRALLWTMVAAHGAAGAVLVVAGSVPDPWLELIWWVGAGVSVVVLIYMLALRQRTTRATSNVARSSHLTYEGMPILPLERPG